ncbi:flagellar hook basal-body protein [Acinetobacter baumannii]|uniref:flagellar hook-basal body protein n=1 Tax=Acinetobacter baumannii TaxID=470 RepID=UPI0004479203|nr:flagellar hook basal-body protein [Acinetobacter baumannii]EXR82114.1 flagellar hook-basal body family protein [Acinetobacter baumannii 541915]MBP4065376.1 flagellar hook basal-body protein [Acinetobacter baumannii]MBU3096867.1 flagellar hook basal-body protein [Acinetobacter baumannii]MCW1473524.1 flagellar hook basal-body protein [Acinetobacter baumannii]MDC4310297.1 flagellar hook basal-body protein [Acinetobacter baumannii]
MIDAISIANSGLTAHQKWLDTISSNISNMQTMGYKKENAQFSNLIATNNFNNVISQQGIGVSLENNYTDFKNGDVQTTNQPYDFAIQGKGFFEIEQPDGSLAYTRIGQFHVNAEGRLALSSGEVLTADIRIPSDVEHVKLTSDGILSGKVIGTGEELELGKIELVSFNNDSQLKKMGNGLYLPTQLSGEPQYGEMNSEGMGTVLQGHLEMSNVDLVSEISNLIMAQRAYQLNARVLQAGDQIMETINNLRR